MSTVSNMTPRELAQFAGVDEWGTLMDEFRDYFTPERAIEIIDVLESARDYVNVHADTDGHAFGVLRAMDKFISGRVGI